MALTNMKRWLCGAAVVVTAGCVAQNETLEAQLGDAPLAGKDGVTRELPWGPSDAPSIFGPDLKTKLEELPREGAAATPPWAGSYWPVYQDSINQKWDGPATDAPSTKYAKAFGVTGVEDAVSRMRGIAGASSRKACSVTADCNAQIGEECAKREGQAAGSCIPTWWGICHAWGPAAILVPEARRPVTINGVTFKVNDIRALVTLVHDSVEEKFVSLRCDADDGQSKIEYDQYGRPKEGDCIDTNAGTLHLLMGNYLGLKQQSFVMDRTFDDEVWNQPLRRYRVTLQKEVTAAEANALVGVTSEGGNTSSLAATLAAGAWKHFEALPVTAGQSVKVQLHGTGDGDLYVKFGAQPTDAAYDCRPFDNGSEETCGLTAPAGAAQLFVSVHGYSASNVTLAIVRGGAAPTAYKFNAAAKRFYEVRSELDYITESDVITDGPFADKIDLFTRTDRYHYILETDAEGRIVGGEWLDESKRHHPDFLWLPLRVSGQSVAEGKIKYADVMNLLNQSVASEEGGPITTTVTERGTVAKGAWKHLGPFQVAPGTMLNVEMTGTGDADLYVRKGAAPTDASYDCRPYKNGSAESCAVEGGAAIYVAVSGYAATSDFTLNIRFTRTTTGGGTTVPPTAHLDVSGNVALGAFATHTVNVIAGKKIVIRSVAANDVDLYLQMGQAPTTSSYLAQAYTSSGNETLEYTPTTTGVLHIGVHGYKASAFTLKTADQ